MQQIQSVEQAPHAPHTKEEEETAIVWQTVYRIVVVYHTLCAMFVQSRAADLSYLPVLYYGYGNWTTCNATHNEVAHSPPAAWGRDAPSSPDEA